jgi:hypothetical protein
MESGLHARRTIARAKKQPADRLNGIEMLMFGLIALAMIDCTVIGWLVAHGLGN